MSGDSKEQPNLGHTSDEAVERFGELKALVCSFAEEGRYEEAIQYATASAKLIRQIVGAQHPAVATVVSTLAGLYSASGNYSAAETLNQQALELRRTVLGEQHPDFATSLNNLAAVYDAMGDYVAAEPLYKQALEIRRRVFGEQHPTYALTLGNLANLYHTLGDHAASESFNKQQMEILRATLGEHHPNFAASLNNLATLYSSMGNYAAAEQLFRQAMEIKRKSLGENHPEFARSLNNLGMLYVWMGDCAAAEPLLKQALEIRREVLGEHHPDYATTLDNLAGLYDAMSDYEAAVSLYRRALEVRRQALGDAHPMLAISLNSLATLASSPALAESLLKQALEIRRKALGEWHADFATSLEALAQLYCATGNYVAAEPLSRQVIEIRRKHTGEQHPDFATSLTTLAVILAATGREAEALGLMEQSLLIDERMIGHIFSVSSERRRTAYLKTRRREFDAFLSLVSQRLCDAPTAVRSAASLVLRRKAIEAEMLATQRDVVLSGRHPDVATALKELKTLRTRIAQKTLAGPGSEGLQAHRQLLAEWGEQKDELEAAIARRLPEMNLEQKLRGIDWQVAVMALPVGATLIEYVRFNAFKFEVAPASGKPYREPARYLAFILPAREPTKVEMVDLGEAELIDSMITTFRESITGEEESQIRGLGALPSSAHRAANKDIGTRLCEKIFTPLLNKLGECKRLLIAPDGNLARLPFEVLPMNDGRRVIEEYRISYLGAGRDVLRFEVTSNRRPTRALVTADPDFDLSAKPPTISATVTVGRQSRDFQRTNLRFDRLPGTRIEGENIAAMLDAELLTDKAALKARLKQCQSPHILHLATHGFFLADQIDEMTQEQFRFKSIAVREDEPEPLTISRSENPLLRSGLALAGVNRWLEQGQWIEEVEDGLLTAEDVTGLDLSDTKLAVLSACETGLGEVRVGEGVFGLRRAFVLAGVKTLVMSLWKVPDEQTRELMEDFYRRILDGQPCASALRAAQLTMKVKHPEPFYWGAFICQGYDGPLSE